MLLAACGSDDSSADKAGTTTASLAPPTTAAPALAPTTSPARLSTCPTGLGSAARDPDQAARCLYAAWKEGDRGKAAAVASSDVVDSLFMTPWSPPDAKLDPCRPDRQEQGSLCTYEHRGATYLLDVRPSEGGVRVTQVQGPLYGE